MRQARVPITFKALRSSAFRPGRGRQTIPDHGFERETCCGGIQASQWPLCTKETAASGNSAQLRFTSLAQAAFSIEVGVRSALIGTSLRSEIPTSCYFGKGIVLTKLAKAKRSFPTSKNLGPLPIVQKRELWIPMNGIQAGKRLACKAYPRRLKVRQLSPSSARDVEGSATSNLGTQHGTQLHSFCKPLATAIQTCPCKFWIHFLGCLVAERKTAAQDVQHRRQQGKSIAPVTPGTATSLLRFWGQFSNPTQPADLCPGCCLPTTLRISGNWMTRVSVASPVEVHLVRAARIAKSRPQHIYGTTFGLYRHNGKENGNY